MACARIASYFMELTQLLILKILIILLQIISLPFEFISLTYEYIFYKPDNKHYKSILITGASSGIGMHFALEMSLQKPAPSMMVLIARREDQLKKVQKQCINNGCSNTIIFSCDVTDKNKMKDIILKCDNNNPFDLIFANAGYRSNLNNNIIESCYKTYNVNIYGVLNTILPIIPRMINRNNGNIIINASIAGLTPHKLFPFYSSSKNGLLSLSENLRSTLHEYNINITCILPGFVETQLITHLNDSKLPLIGKIKVNKAIKKIIYDTKCNRAISGFPFIPTVLGYLYESLLPRFKQIVLDNNIIDRLIGWYNIVPNRKWTVID